MSNRLTAPEDLKNQLQRLVQDATNAALQSGGAPRAEAAAGPPGEHATPGGPPVAGTPGAEALIGYQGQVVAQAYAGSGVLFAADGSLLPQHQREPVKPNHLWEIASITKTLVAVAALVQVDRGTLDLDAPVADYLPEFGQGPDGAASPGSRKRISIRQLLNHTSGLPAVVEPWRVTGGREAKAAYLLSRPLAREPGSQHVYSCAGFMTLGLALEQITGLSLPEVVAQTVTRPLGMTSTSYTPAPGRPVAATEYDLKTHRGLVQGEVHDEAAASFGGSGNAGLFSDARDLFVFGEELRTGATGLLSDTTRALISTGTLSDQQVAEVGYNQSMGFRLGQQSFMGTTDQSVLGHTGFVGTSLVVDPDHQLVVVLLTNRVHPHRESFNTMPLRQAVAQAARNWVGARAKRLPFVGPHS